MSIYNAIQSWNASNASSGDLKPNIHVYSAILFSWHEFEIFDDEYFNIILSLSKKVWQNSLEDLDSPATKTILRKLFKFLVQFA